MACQYQGHHLVAQLRVVHAGAVLLRRDEHGQQVAGVALGAVIGNDPLHHQIQLVHLRRQGMQFRAGDSR